MLAKLGLRAASALVAVALCASLNDANAGVVVDIVNANTATATIALTDANNITYNAVVTVTFDQAVNLSADSLNVTALLVDPSNPPATLPANATVDSSFPVLVSIEPPVPLFMSGYEMGQTGNGELAFFNTYEIEVHTTDLVCASSTSPYRLYKAPHGSTTFADVTDNLFSGSVRARGRGGAFSQFLVVNDSRPQFLLGLPVIALGKLTDLTTRLLAATLSGVLRGNLTPLLVDVSTALVLLDYATAIANLNTFIDDVTADAGVSIANEWTPDGSVNDAGELISLAQTLNFTLGLLQGSGLCIAPPP
jgi:hypothetical protein